MPKPVNRVGLHGWWVLVASFWGTVFTATFFAWLLQ